MYAKLFERRRGVQSAYDGGGGGGGGAFSTKTQETSRQTGPLRTCPVVLHRFVDICPYN